MNGVEEDLEGFQRICRHDSYLLMYMGQLSMETTSSVLPEHTTRNFRQYRLISPRLLIGSVIQESHANECRNGVTNGEDQDQKLNSAWSGQKPVCIHRIIQRYNTGKRACILNLLWIDLVIINIFPTSAARLDCVHTENSPARVGGNPTTLSRSIWWP